MLNATHQWRHLCEATQNQYVIDDMCGYVRVRLLGYRSACLILRAGRRRRRAIPNGEYVHRHRWTRSKRSSKADIRENYEWTKTSEGGVRWLATTTIEDAPKHWDEEVGWAAFEWRKCIQADLFRIILADYTTFIARVSCYARPTLVNALKLAYFLADHLRVL